MAARLFCVGAASPSLGLQGVVIRQGVYGCPIVDMMEGRKKEGLMTTGGVKSGFVVLCVSCFLATSSLILNPSPVLGTPTFLWESGAEHFTDAEKTGGDDNFCWAAAAANVLKWTGWDANFADEDAIFSEFKTHWTGNHGSWARFGWEWWFTGSVTEDAAWDGLQEEGSSNYSGGGGYYSKSLYDDHVRTWEDLTDSPNLSAAGNLIPEYIDEGYGTTMSVIFTELNNENDDTDNETWAHAVTLWGYEANSNTITHIYLSDSDDGEHEYFCQEILYSNDFNSWYLPGYGSADFNYISSLAGLLPNTENIDPASPVIPEPTTVLLFGTGLLAVIGFGRRKVFMNR